MPEFFIQRSYGYVGTDSADVYEAETLEEALDMAWDDAVAQVEVWGEPYDPEKHDGDL